MAKRDKTPVKSFDTNNHFQSFIETEKDWMYTRIFEAITEANEKSEDFASIMEAKISETMSIITMKSYRSEWITSLNLAIKWYEKTENFEFCSKILKLIKSIRTED